MAQQHHEGDLPMSTPQGRAPNGTVAYSNNDCERFAGVRNHDGEFFTGYQWQCVEFARRWLWDDRGLMLPDIDIAAEIFFVPHMYDAINHREVRVKPVRNGTSTEPPAAGSYLIYAPEPTNFPGHIAVITAVDADFAYICDQNRDFRRWPDASYAMKRALVRDAKGRYTLVDPEDPVIGWVEFPDSPPLPIPADASLADTWVDEATGKTHAKMRRPIPKDYHKTPDYTKQQRRRTFWAAMFEFRPHWSVMPLMIARIMCMLFYYRAKYALRGFCQRLGLIAADPASPTKPKSE